MIGVGVCDHMTLYELRGTMNTWLFEEGPADASVGLRSDNRDHRLFVAYENLRGSLFHWKSFLQQGNARAQAR